MAVAHTVQQSLPGRGPEGFSVALGLCKPARKRRNRRVNRSEAPSPGKTSTGHPSPRGATCCTPLRSNAPAVRSAEKERNEERWHGTRVSVLIRGAWATYGARIVKYLRQLAVITPYAAITFRYTSEAGGRSDVAMRFARRTGHMPPPPQETMHHPAAGTMRCAGHGSATRTRCVR